MSLKQWENEKSNQTWTLIQVEKHITCTVIIMSGLSDLVMCSWGRVHLAPRVRVFNVTILAVLLSDPLYCQIGGFEVFEFENLVSCSGSFLCSQLITYAYFIISSEVKGRYQISLCDLCCTMLERDFTSGPLFNSESLHWTKKRENPGLDF